MAWARHYQAPVTSAEIEADGGRWVLTPDGRYIEYFVCGDLSRSPSTKDVYFQHGYGQTGKSILTQANICEAAERLKLRIVSPTQPGFGLSSHYPIGRIRKLSEWPADISLILKKEKISSFYVSGVSAGCVHAFTIAHAFKDRVLGVGVNTPTTPLKIEAEFGTMALPTKLTRMILEYPYIGDFLAMLLSLLDARSRMTVAPDCAAALDKMERLAIHNPDGWYKSAFDGYLSDQERGTKKGHRGWVDNVFTMNEDVPFPVHELAAITDAGKAFVRIYINAYPLFSLT